MISASAGFGTTVQSDNRKFLAKLLLNGNELSADIVKLVFSKGSCGTPEAFDIGAVVSSVMTAELKNLSTSVKGETLQAQIGLEVNGAYEYITVGYFTVTEAKKTAYTTILTAYGNTVTKTGQIFSPPSTQTIANIGSEIATETGCTVTFDAGIDTTETVTKPMQNLTTYQALQIVASLVGGYAVDTNTGNIAIHKYDDTSTLSVNAGMMLRLPDVEEADFTINGVTVIVREESTDDDDNVIPAETFPLSPTGNENLIVANEYMTASIYTNIFSANLVGYTYRPAFIDLSMGDPRIEGNDVLSVTDVDNTTYIVPCHSVTHIYDGGLRTQVFAFNATAQEDDINTSAPITQRLSAINAATITAQASAESAVQSAQTALESAQSAAESASSALASAVTASEAAESALSDAQAASINAQSAALSANSALSQLSEVEKVVDALTWISEHGQYTATEDTEVVEGKWYFTATFTLTTDTALDSTKTYYVYDSVNDVYEIVENPIIGDIGTYYEGVFDVINSPSGDPSSQGYYELSSVNEAISNYVATHLALTDDGLYVQIDDNACKMQITSTGILLYDASGTVIAEYGSSIILGDASAQHIEQTSGELGFYQGNTKVAYISGTSLYITQAEITQSMRIGDFIWNVGSGRINLRYSPLS